MRPACAPARFASSSAPRMRPGPVRLLLSALSALSGSQLFLSALSALSGSLLFLSALSALSGWSLPQLFLSALSALSG